MTGFLLLSVLVVVIVVALGRTHRRRPYNPYLSGQKIRDDADVRRSLADQDWHSAA